MIFINLDPEIPVVLSDQTICVVVKWENFQRPMLTLTSQKNHIFKTFLYPIFTHIPVTLNITKHPFDNI